MPNFEEDEQYWKEGYPPQQIGKHGYPILDWGKREYDTEGVPERVKKYAHLFNRKEGVR